MNSTSRFIAFLLIASFKPTAQPVAAQTTHVESAPASAGLEDADWILTWLGEQRLTITAGRPAPTLVLSGTDQRVSAKSGCNELSGAYKLDGATLQFSSVATTSRECTDPVLKQRESQLLRVLNEARGWKVSKNTLTLTGPRGQLARFERKSPTPE